MPEKIGRYRIDESIGRGGMGVVYKAWDPDLHRAVALKTIVPALVADDEVKQRLKREAQAAAKLQHPNVVTIYELGEAENQLFISMEYIVGENLGDALESGVTLERKIEIIIGICRALEYAHRAGIVHRDIKPSNVLIGEDGSVKLLDFGIAHLADSQLTRTGTTMGTPEYMSPELVEGRALDRRSDIFSCGVVLYEMLTGQSPFRHERITSIMYRIVNHTPVAIEELEPETPQPLVRVVGRMLEKDPDKRYQNLDEALDELDQLLSTLFLAKASKASEMRNVLSATEDLLDRASPSDSLTQRLDGTFGQELRQAREETRVLSRPSDTSFGIDRIEAQIEKLSDLGRRIEDIVTPELPKIESQAGTEQPETPEDAMATRLDKPPQTPSLASSDPKGPAPSESTEPEKDEDATRLLDASDLPAAARLEKSKPTRARSGTGAGPTTARLESLPDSSPRKRRLVGVGAFFGAFILLVGWIYFQGREPAANAEVDADEVPSVETDSPSLTPPAPDPVAESAPQPTTPARPAETEVTADAPSRTDLEADLQAAFVAGRSEEALNLLDQIESDGPLNALQLYVRGWAHLTEGRRSRARSALVASLAADESNAQARVLLGQVYDADGNPEAAKQEFLRVLRMRTLSPADSLRLRRALVVKEFRFPVVHLKSRKSLRNPAAEEVSLGELISAGRILRFVSSERPSDSRTFAFAVIESIEKTGDRIQVVLNSGGTFDFRIDRPQDLAALDVLLAQIHGFPTSPTDGGIRYRFVKN